MRLPLATALILAAGTDSVRGRLPASRVQPTHSYAIQARIEYEGKLRWLTNQHYPVLTRGGGNTVELRVAPVAD